LSFAAPSRDGHCYDLSDAGCTRACSEHVAVSFLEFKHHLEPNMPLAPGDVKSPRARLNPWLPSSSVVALLIGKVAARGAGGDDTHEVRAARGHLTKVPDQARF